MLPLPAFSSFSLFLSLLSSNGLLTTRSFVIFQKYACVLGPALNLCFVRDAAFFCLCFYRMHHHPITIVNNFEAHGINEYSSRLDKNSV